MRLSDGGSRTPGALSLWFAFAIALYGCSPAKEDATVPTGDPTTDPIVVYTVNYPLAYFAERIGGDAVDVRLPIPPDVDPAAWSPDAETIAQYQQADLVLLNGAGYAAWVSRASLPESRLVDTSAGFPDRFLRVEDVVMHSHGPEGEHSHGDIAFTIWLDSELALQQAAAARDALIRARPELEATFRVQYDYMASELEAVDDGIRAVFAMLGGQAVIFSHPVYQYLARRYELNARSLHWEPDQALSADDLAALSDMRQSHPADVVIWEAQPLPETVATLDELGIMSVVFDPCGNRPAEGDYLACMRRNQVNAEALL